MQMLIVSLIFWNSGMEKLYSNCMQYFLSWYETLHRFVCTYKADISEDVQQNAFLQPSLIQKWLILKMEETRNESQVKWLRFEIHHNFF